MLKMLARGVHRFLSTPGVFVVVAGIPATSGMPQDVRRVVDMRFLGKGVVEIGAQWGRGYGNPVAFVGDIDGDGFGDFVVRDQRDDLGIGTLPGAILVFGQAEVSARTTLSGFRTTYLRYGNEFSGFFAFDFDYPGLGDVDRDGYDDFVLGSSSTDWQGAKDSGTGLLIFGAPLYPDEVHLDALDASGVRSVRFVSVEPELQSGAKVAFAGDLNGDGAGDIAVSSYGGRGTEDGQSGAGRVHIVYGRFDFSESVRLSEVGQTIPGLGRAQK